MIKTIYIHTLSIGLLGNYFGPGSGLRELKCVEELGMNSYIPYFCEHTSITAPNDAKYSGRI